MQLQKNNLIFHKPNILRIALLIIFTSHTTLFWKSLHKYFISNSVTLDFLLLKASGRGHKFYFNGCFMLGVLKIRGRLFFNETINYVTASTRKVKNHKQFFHKELHYEIWDGITVLLVFDWAHVPCVLVAFLSMSKATIPSFCQENASVSA